MAAGSRAGGDLTSGCLGPRQGAFQKYLVAPGFKTVLKILAGRRRRFNGSRLSSVIGHPISVLIHVDCTPIPEVEDHRSGIYMEYQGKISISSIRPGSSKLLNGLCKLLL